MNIVSKIKIETIVASNADAEKTEVYRLLNMVHAMAGRCAVAKIDGWQLSETCTMESYVRTAWTNGIVDVIAESWPHDGDHRYEMRQCKEME